MEKKLLSEIQKNNRLLTAALTLLVKGYEREGDSGAPRIELLLASSGLGYQDIAEIVGKKPDAVRMLLKRNANAVKSEKN